MSAKGLGKGFDVLMPISIDLADVVAGAHEKVHQLAINTVLPNKDQPRQKFDDTTLKELAQSIKQYGIVQPLIVARVETNLYTIIAGERRWRAAQLAGLKDVPAIIRTATDHEQLELALLENVQRTDLTPIELAAALFRLHDQFNQSYDDIARRIGKAATTVSNIIRLLALSPKIQAAVQAGRVSEGHARSLLSLQKYPKEQQILFDHIVNKQWSVRQAEQFVVATKRRHDMPASSVLPKTILPDEVADQLQKRLGAKQVILHRSTKGSGKMIITYATEDELTKIVAKIMGQY